jgi:hypothetical protein
MALSPIRPPLSYGLVLYGLVETTFFFKRSSAGSMFSAMVMTRGYQLALSSSGRTPHRDRNRIAAHEPVDLPQDPGKAARVAETDLARRAEEYIEAYRAAKAQGKEAW